MKIAGSRAKTVATLVAFVVALAAGLGAGYVLWGRPADWYAVKSPETLPAGDENDLIRYGRDLVVKTGTIIGRDAADPALAYAGNDLACTNCHINAGLKPFAAPFVSTWASYPLMINDRVITLPERINGCMTRSMNGKRMPEDSREMRAIIAYIRYLGTGTPEGVRVAGMGLLPLAPPAEPPSAERGAAQFKTTCVRCHGADGQGTLDVPPLWGDGSYNAAAGLADIRMASAFIRANMPWGITYLDPVLSEQQAWDLAAYIDSQPRPPAPPAGN
jgi:thiosulfate dehydrogenase